MMIVNQEPLFRLKLSKAKLRHIIKDKCKTNVEKAQADFMLKNFKRNPRIVERMYKMITTLDNDKILFPTQNVLVELAKYVVAMEACEEEADNYANLEGDE